MVAKAPLAIIIIIVSLVGIGGTLYQIYLPPNNTPQLNCNATYSQAYDIPSPLSDGKYYQAVNANFTNVGQSFGFGSSLGGVTFVTRSFSDPSMPHYDNGQCVNGTTGALANITVEVKYSDGTSVLLSMTYKGNQGYQQVLSSHTAPTAGLLWVQGHPYIELVLSKT